jgi:hypothetical protein
MAITSTIYNSAATSLGFQACIVHLLRPSSRTVSKEIAELMIFQGSILRTVRIIAFVDQSSLLLRTAMNFSCSSLPTAYVHYIVT